MAPAKRGLRHLGRGSVIAFGSGKEIDGQRRWTLDTVFVVKDFVEYGIRKAQADLKNRAPDTFLDITGGPLADDEKAPDSARLRLYRGATPDDPVDRMFSFFPAISAGRGQGFERPFVDLPREYFNPSNWQAPKGLGKDLKCGELRCLWELLIEQVSAAGLVLGTRAELLGRFQ